MDTDLKDIGHRALLEHQEFLNELQEGIWLAGTDGRLVFANRPLAVMLGYQQPKELVNQRWQDLLPSGKVDSIEQAVSGNKTSHTTDTTMLDHDSRSIPVRIALKRYTSDGKDWLFGSVIPTPPADHGIAESVNRRIIDQFADGICIIHDGRISCVNARFEELTGYSYRQLAVIDFKRLAVSSDRELLSQALADSTTNRTSQRLTISLRTRSARSVKCDLQIVTAECEGDIVTICFLGDLSSAVRNEQARTDFIAAISHELRNPLAAIKEAVSLVVDTSGSELAESSRRYLAIAQEEIARLSRMVSNLMEIAQTESGKIQLNPKPVSINELVDKTVDSMAMLLRKKQISVNLQIPEKLPKLLGDIDRLRLVLNNILDNAIKYSPPDSTIRIAARQLPTELPATTRDDLLPGIPYVELTISDTGPGIPAEFFERIFGKYERIDPQGPGVGLGLAIARSVVQNHNGRISVTSKLGEGTSFHLTLPAA